MPAPEVPAPEVPAPEPNGPVLTLVTVEEYVASAFSGDVSATDAQVAWALGTAEARFYSLTRRQTLGYWFLPTDVEMVCHGCGDTLLHVGYPVLKITSVKLNGVSITDYVKSWRSHYLYYAGVWTEGFANIDLQITVGDPEYAPAGTVPLDVKRAIMRLARNYLIGDRIAGERYIERRPASDEAVPPPTITGDREVDAVIRTYTVHDLTGGMVG